MSLLKSKVQVRFFKTAAASVDDVRVALDFLLARKQIIVADDGNVGSDVQAGWCAPTHLADANLDPARCIEDGVLRLFYVRAERVVPAAVLKQKLAEAIAARVAAGGQLPGKKERKQMKESIEAGLKPQQPVTRKFIEFWWDFSNGLAVVGNASESKVAELGYLISQFSSPDVGRHPVAFVPKAGEVLTRRLVQMLKGEEIADTSWTIAGPLCLSNEERAAKIGGTTAPKKSATKACVIEDGMGVDSCQVLAEKDGTGFEFNCDASGGVRGLCVSAKLETIGDRMKFFQKCHEVLIGLAGDAAEAGRAEEDFLYEQAKAFVLESKRASTAALQRNFRIGYMQAAWLMDMLEERGVVGPMRGSEPREILVSV